MNITRAPLLHSKQPKWIEFKPVLSKTKTKIWEVYPIGKEESNVALGSIKWFGRWRCYAFFASYDPILEKQCLRDIADFCEEQTNLHRQSKRKKL